jgi:GNAT superfamily N-acetyltransferase
VRMDTLKIRPAASGDAATLGPLLEQLGYPTDAAEIPERIEKLQARPGTTVLVVEEKARGQGVGSALVARAEDWAIEHGALRISLTSALHRESAHEFYKARDYEHTGVRLTKIFVNRSGAAKRGEGRSSRKGGAKDARNRSRG